MSEILYQINKDYLKILNYPKNTGWLGNLLMLIDSGTFDKFNSVNSEDKQKIKDLSSFLTQHTFYPYIEKTEQDPTKCILKSTDISEKDMLDRMASLVEYQTDIRIIVKKLKQEAEKRKEEFHLSSFNSPILFFFKENGNKAPYAQNGRRYFKNCYDLIMDTLDVELVGHKSLSKALLEGVVHREEYNKIQDAFAGKAYVLMDMEGNGYMDQQKRVGPLNKARIFNNQKDAKKYSKRIHSRRFIVIETDLQFNCVKDQVEAIPPLASKLCSLADREAIKKSMSLKQIENDQLKLLALQKYLYENNLNPTAIAKSILGQFSEEKTQKEKVDFLLEAQRPYLDAEIVKSKPAIKTL